MKKFLVILGALILIGNSVFAHEHKQEWEHHKELFKSKYHCEKDNCKCKDNCDCKDDCKCEKEKDCKDCKHCREKD